MPSVNICQRRQWQPTPVLLPGKSHRWRSLVGCSPWGRKESDTTERLHFPFSLSCIGEGNGNPLQCSCLENPRDGGHLSFSLSVHKLQMPSEKKCCLCSIHSWLYITLYYIERVCCIYLNPLKWSKCIISICF